MDASIVAYRIRTVHIGVYATYMTVALLVALPFVPGHPRISLVPYVGLCVLAVIGASLFGFALPWPAMFAAGWGDRTLYAWSALDIMLVTLACALTGGPTSEMVLLYALTTIFFAASYPSLGQASLFALTAVCYLSLDLAWARPASWWSVLARLSLVGIVWFMAAFLARERSGEMAGHRSARALAEHRAEQLSALARTASDIATLDADEAMAGVTHSLVGLGFDLVSFCVLEGDGRHYRNLHARGLPASMARQGQSGETGVVGLVRERRSTVAMEDYALDPVALPELVRAGVKAVAGAPVWVGGRLEAVLMVASLERRSLSPADLEVLDILAGQIGRALENAGRFVAEHQSALAAQEESRRDYLTGLGNRRHAVALLESLTVGDAVVMIDLDHFKSVNDRHGHAEGDRVLRDLAAYLRRQVRGGDDVARYGGEEFVLVLRKVQDDALAATQRLLQGWRDCLPVTSFSAGVALYGGTEAVEVVVGRADAALYAAKMTGRDRVCLYGPELEAPALSS